MPNKSKFKEIFLFQAVRLRAMKSQLTKVTNQAEHAMYMPLYVYDNTTPFHLAYLWVSVIDASRLLWLGIIACTGFLQNLSQSAFSSSVTHQPPQNPMYSYHHFI